MTSRNSPLHAVLNDSAALIERIADRTRAELTVEEVGRLTFVGHGIARIDGLPGVGSQELVRFPGRSIGNGVQSRPERSRRRAVGSR
ncbi:MAG: hypothetical protein KatS3mg105_4995 [Gemmatales bacterium]|nr:MAG: hypothetical protein KatS3mg105_4995 [Gemmatales bacterium]